MSSEVELETLETHVLACEYCVDRLETLETQIAVTQKALQKLESRPASRKSVDRFGRWKTWFTFPKLSFATAGLVAMAAGAILFSIPRDVSITAYRGSEAAMVSEGRPLHLHLNAAGLDPGPVAVELTDKNGSIIWKGASSIAHDKVDVNLPRITESGPSTFCASTLFRRPEPNPVFCANSHSKQTGQDNSSAHRQDKRGEDSGPPPFCLGLCQSNVMVMQLQFSNPELQAKVEQWLADTGRPVEELVEDAMAGYFEELAQVRETQKANPGEKATHERLSA